MDIPIIISVHNSALFLQKMVEIYHSDPIVNNFDMVV